MKVLHVASIHSITERFFVFLQDNFDAEDHAIISHEQKTDHQNIKLKHTSSTGLAWFLSFIHTAYKSDKIILHGLFDFYAVVFLFFQPWLLKKCYWVIWGGDLYSYQFPRTWKRRLIEFFRRPVIRKMGNIITYVEGDVELARQWYGTKAKYHECIMYTSNVFGDYQIPSIPHSVINLQIGNSADPSNNHFEILERLLPFRDQDIAIYAPLSYGDQEHAQRVISMGNALFGDKFKPMTEFMSFDKYLTFLGEIDIAVFNHKRQQAMGNIITLLGLGKKVYLRKDITSWDVFESKKIEIYDICELNMDIHNEFSLTCNKGLIKQIFSKENLIKQLNLIFSNNAI